MGTIREGQEVNEKAGDPHEPPPKGPQAEREDVEPPPTKPKEGPGYTMFQHSDPEKHDTPPDKDGIKEVKPELTDPVKPNCECFDSQTEIYLDSNAYVWKNIYGDIKLLKKKIKEASEQVGKNLDLINQNKDFSERICCGGGLPSRCKELGYDCKKIVKLP
jgi:hypothetical protein